MSIFARMNILRKTSRLSRFMCTAPTEVKSEVKLSRIKRIGNYFKNILDDYKAVGVETLQDIKDRPIKSSFYFTLLGGGILFAKKNPSEDDFRQQLTDNCNELLQVGEPIRNPNSDNYMQTLMRGYNAGELRYLNFLLFSIMWRDNFHRDTDLFAAQAKPLKVGWLDLPERTVDIGILGKWWWIEKAMEDYDINPNEWPETSK